uniref:Ribosomal protein S10 n=1 Tax=Plectus sambesii TaxID=2011161 RepID=A0A914V9X0_9BILA
MLGSPIFGSTSIATCRKGCRFPLSHASIGVERPDIDDNSCRAVSRGVARRRPSANQRRPAGPYLTSRHVMTRWPRAGGIKQKRARQALSSAPPYYPIVGSFARKERQLVRLIFPTTDAKVESFDLRHVKRSEGQPLHLNLSYKPKPPWRSCQRR